MTHILLISLMEYAFDTSDSTFLLYFSIDYRDFSVKSKLIISLFKTVRLSLLISLFRKRDFIKIFLFLF